ncbi:MAG: DUF1826 domain-containing protein [Pseudomonadota bacterium]
MSVLHAQLKNAAVGVGIADTPDDLSVIHKPGCAAAIWRRQPPVGFRNWINGLDPQQLPRARLLLHPDTVPEAIAQWCDSSNLDHSEERNWLEADVAELAKQFTALMDAPYLRLRMDVINTNACRKFHIDAIHARLICTYSGTGTQYGISTNGDEPTRVFTVPTGAPMILRGTLWPADPPAGLLHRSPPIAGTGETRLVLVIDPLWSIDDE